MPHYHRTCKVCQTPFVYHPAGKDKGREEQRGLCCSMACKSEYVRANKPGPYSRVYAGYCDMCGSPFVSRKQRPQCGPRCRARARATPKVLTKTCKHCAREYQVVTTDGRPTEYCSAECKAVVDGARRRVTKAKRKALQKSASVENVDPFVVFDRDGWRCQLCGDPTPKELRGTYDDKAPELDHVVALSNGGAHSYANAQCACRSCNILKSNKKFFVPSCIEELLG